MGGFNSRPEPDVTSNDGVRKINVLGLYGAGRTSLVSRLTTGKLPEQYMSLEVQMMQHEDLTLAVWDYTGREEAPGLFRLDCYGSDGIIYMIDSADPSRFEESLWFLNALFKDENLTKITLMVVANKQDLDDAVGPEVIEEKVKKNCKIGPGFTVFVMPMTVTAEDDHSMQLAHRLFMKTMKRKAAKKVKSGLIPRAWETAEKDAEDSAEEQDEVTDERDMKKKKEKNGKKTFFKDPIHMFKCLLTR